MLKLTEIQQIFFKLDPFIDTYSINIVRMWMSDSYVKRGVFELHK